MKTTKSLIKNRFLKKAGYCGRRKFSRICELFDVFGVAVSKEFQSEILIQRIVKLLIVVYLTILTRTISIYL